MKNKQALFSAAEMDENRPGIDLHSSKTIDQAIDQLEQELFFYYQQEAKYCEVIYGGGSGKLKDVVLKKLEQNPMVKDVKKLHAGSCLIIF